MYDTDTPTNIDVLDMFHAESETLNTAIKKHFKYHILEEDGELFAAGSKFYDSVDLLVERGLLATARMLIVKNETISFNRVSQILLSEFYTKKKDRAKIDDIQATFKSLRAKSNEVFDMFWHVSHLHKDISDDRFIKHFKLMHSCAGPGRYTQLYDHLEKFSEIITELDSKYVVPVLIKTSRIFIDSDAKDSF